MTAYFNIKKPKESGIEVIEESEDDRPAFLTPKKKHFVMLTKEEREQEIAKSELTARKAKPPVGPGKVIGKAYELGKRGVRATLSPFVSISKLKKASDEKKYREIAKKVKESKEKDNLMAIHKKESQNLDKKYVVNVNGREKIPEEMSDVYDAERKQMISRQEKELALVGKLEKKKN